MLLVFCVLKHTTLYDKVFIYNNIGCLSYRTQFSRYDKFLCTFCISVTIICDSACRASRSRRSGVVNPRPLPKMLVAASAV